MFDLTNYSSEIQSILGPHQSGHRFMPLAPREALVGEGLNRLARSSVKQLFSAPIASDHFAACVRSALFLYFSALEESHRISQEIPSSSGSFLHGIMHRQETDFGNSKYWFRKVPNHDVYPALQQSALGLLQASDTPAGSGLYREIEQRSHWDPHWFVDQCQKAYRASEPDLEKRLMEIQRLEWQLLFDYCYRKAVESS